MLILRFGIYQLTDANKCERNTLEVLEANYHSIYTDAAY